jgi:outer membrane lipoprotein carrier protein
MLFKGSKLLKSLFLKPALLICLIAWSGMAFGGEDAASLLDQLAKRYNRLKSLVADFTQSFESRALGRGIEEQGKLYVKVPGMMRWDYLTPEKKLAVCNGSDTWLYLEEDNTVIKGRLDPSKGNIAILSLLSGRADLNEIFRGEVISEQEEETRVKIWLKQRSDDFDYLILSVQTKNSLIAQIEVIDPIGNRMIYSFKNIKENVPVDSQLFYFSVPPNARIKFETSAFE